MKTWYLALWLAIGTRLLSPAHGQVAPAAAADFALVKKQFRQSRWQFPPHNNESGAVSKTTADQIARWIQTQSAYGSWSDIDYTDQTPNFWRTEQHLRRTAQLADTYAEIRDHGQDNPALRHAILQAMSYWITKDFRNPNWWHNEIGVPNLLSDIMLVMESEMTPELKDGGLKILARSTLSRTGQNLVWQALVVFKAALLRGDAALARQADKRIVLQLGYRGEEGLQIDESFHQHGPQQQFGNYGLAFATEIAGWAWIWRGTPWALSDARLAVLRDYLLGGEGAVVANGTMDISACGRQFFPGSPADKGKAVLAILQIMLAVDPLHAAEYQAVIQADSANPDNIRSGDRSQAASSFNRDFYRSDYMVQRRPGFYASVKMCSRRVIGTEKVNDENIQGRYLADGATFVYHGSLEYTDIFPVWDWRRIPGTTCAKDGGTLTPAGRMPTDFAGGVSDGVCGASGLDYNRDNVTGRKSWFFFDGEIVCLGAGLTGSGQAPLITSIEQSLLRGDIVAAVDGGLGVVQPKEPHLLTSARWVWQGGQGYIFPSATDVTLGGNPQTGAWNKVYLSGADATITKDVFSLWIEHGTRPAAGYAYIILPGVDARQTAAYAARPPLAILANTPQLQAVRDPRTRRTLAIFFAAGALQTALGKLAVDRPCALSLRETGGSPQVVIADPAQLSPRIQLTIGSQVVSVDLPQGETAGKSVAVAIP